MFFAHPLQREGRWPEFGNVKCQALAPEKPPRGAQVLCVLNWSEFRNMMSQIVTSKGRGGRRKLPRVFTEHGVIMAAAVLNSERAVRMSVLVVRAFVQMRNELMTRAHMEKRLADIEKTLVGHDTALRDLYGKMRPLLLPPPVPPRRRIGFRMGEE